MKLFGRKRVGVTLVRAWCSPFGEAGPAGELLALVDQVLAATPAKPLEGAINHGYVQPLSSLRRALAKMKPVQLDALMVHDEAGEIICSFGAEGASVGDRARAFEIFALLPPASHALQDKLLRALMGYGLHYGYARALGPDFNALTETLARRGFFDATIEVDGGRADWLVPEMDVRAGAVRGLYPANVFSAIGLARLAGSGLRLPSSAPTVGETLWRPRAAERAELLRLNPGYRRYLHFGEA
jgi:hypothetical protein